jgi:hypothetical protein
MDKKADAILLSILLFNTSKHVLFLYNMYVHRVILKAAKSFIVRPEAVPLSLGSNSHVKQQTFKVKGELLVHL